MENRYIDDIDFGKNKELLTRIKRVAAIHDISCLGRCALTVILPVISMLGHQVVPLPTALLSTHTGGFENIHFRDLTDDMEKISKHWKEIDTDFDSVYSGFLGSVAQIDTVLKFIEAFKEKNDGDAPLILVDPVMGDDGVLYSTYTEELMRGMKKLCHKADIITPNLTEACFLTDTSYTDYHILKLSDVKNKTRELISALYSSFGTKKIVVTGIVTDDGNVSNAVFDGEKTPVLDDESIKLYTHKKLCRAYPGTGDVFSSVLLCKCLMGDDFYSAVKCASDVVSFLIEKSENYHTPIRDGLVIEPYLREILNMYF